MKRLLEVSQNQKPNYKKRSKPQSRENKCRFCSLNFCCCYSCSFFQSNDNKESFVLIFFSSKLQRKLVFFNFVSYLTVNMFSTALLTLGSIKHVAEDVSEVKDNTQTMKAEFREGFKETQGKHI